MRPPAGRDKPSAQAGFAFFERPDLLPKLPASNAPSLESLRERFGARYKWIALAIVMVGTVASLLSSTIVNVTLPHLGADFQVGNEYLQWVSSAHMASTTITMLALPWLLARFGFRRMFFVSMALLAAGSLFGGLAPNFAVLVAMRTLQGAASGLLQPLATVLILRAFPADEQGRASGYYGFGVVLAPAAGPTLGGLLTDLVDWRAVFFVSLPFAIAAGALAWRLLPKMPAPPDERPFDWLGMALVAGFVSSMLVFFVQLHDYGPASAATTGWLVVAVVTMVALLVWERSAEAPLVDFKVFRNADFRIGIVVALIYGAGLFGSTLLVPLFVQHALHYSATASGTLLLPAGIALALTIPLAGRLADRLSPRPLVVGGLVAFGASFALMALAPRAGFWPLAAMLVLGRIGLGLILPALSLGTVRRVEPAQVGQAASLFNFTRMLGGAIGTSAIAIFVEARAKALAVQAAALQPAGWAELRAFQEGFVVLAALFAVAAMAAWRMQARKP